MTFTRDYSAEAIEKNGGPAPSDEASEQAAYEDFKRYLADFDDEQLSIFLQAVVFLNFVAEDFQGRFEYTVNELKKTGSFRLVAKELSMSKVPFSGRAFHLALERFPDLQIKPENGYVVVCGSKWLGKEDE